MADNSAAGSLGDLGEFALIERITADLADDRSVVARSDGRMADRKSVV
mgnify:CR=1 FL=1